MGESAIPVIVWVFNDSSTHNKALLDTREFFLIGQFMPDIVLIAIKMPACWSGKADAILRLWLDPDEGTC